MLTGKTRTLSVQRAWGWSRGSGAEPDDFAFIHERVFVLLDDVFRNVGTVGSDEYIEECGQFEEHLM